MHVPSSLLKIDTVLLLEKLLMVMNKLAIQLLTFLET